jgi:hypothetical protein
MTDQPGADAAPAQYETKDLPHGYAPAAVPYTDSTHLDRDAAPAEQPTETADRPEGDEKKATTTARRTTSGSAGKSGS